jgi:hypothetical protein
MYEHLRDVRRCDSRGVLRHVPDRPISVGLRTPAFGADTTGEREVPDRHVVRGPNGSPGPRPARPAVNIHSFVTVIHYVNVYRHTCALYPKVITLL